MRWLDEWRIKPAGRLPIKHSQRARFLTWKKDRGLKYANDLRYRAQWQRWRGLVAMGQHSAPPSPSPTTGAASQRAGSMRTRPSGLASHGCNEGQAHGSPMTSATRRQNSLAGVQRHDERNKRRGASGNLRTEATLRQEVRRWPDPTFRRLRAAAYGDLVSCPEGRVNTSPGGPGVRCATPLSVTR